jgi:uncharacterized protein (TIGR02452 family)
MSLKTIATETLRILEEGKYRAPSGQEVFIREAVSHAVRNTVLVRPADSEPVTTAQGAKTQGAATIEVTEETTAQAARRLASVHDAPPAALNFASAKNPGGGFLGGARAQEEDLARASALYACLRTQRPYYDLHRASTSMLYTDHVIYSPDVPFFRNDRLDLLEEPFRVSIVTAAAPNAGEALRRDANALPAIHDALERRAEKVLEVVASRGHRCIVLGAWGCGVFRNDPAMVASVFARWLRDTRFRGAFERVVFAVYDLSPGKRNLTAFREVFS